MSYVSRRVREDGQGRANAEEWARYLIQAAVAKTNKRIAQLNHEREPLRIQVTRDPISFRGRAG